MINVISQSTAEIRQETEELWMDVRELMDKGYDFYSAVREVKGINYTPQNRWFIDLKECAKRDGYELRDKYGRES